MNVKSIVSHYTTGIVKGTPEPILDPDTVTPYGSSAHHLVQCGARCKHAALAHWPFLCPPQNQHPPSAHVTPLPRPEASHLLASSVSCLLGNTCTDLGWGGHSQQQAETSVHCPSAGTIAPALNTPDPQDSSLNKCKVLFWRSFPRAPALAVIDRVVLLSFCHRLDIKCVKLKGIITIKSYSSCRTACQICIPQFSFLTFPFLTFP